MFRWPWKARIASAVSCPVCQGTVWIPSLRAYAYATGSREHVGDVCECATCACVCTILLSGNVLRARRVTQPAATTTPAPWPGGTETGRPGALDADMYDPTYAGPQ